MHFQTLSVPSWLGYSATSSGSVASTAQELTPPGVNQSLAWEGQDLPRATVGQLGQEATCPEILASSPTTSGLS